MNAVTPRAPWWMPQPANRETFGDFWTRVGMDIRDIDKALRVHFAGAEDVANDRLADLYARRNQREYETKRDAWCRSAAPNALRGPTRFT